MRNFLFDGNGKEFWYTFEIDPCYDSLLFIMEVERTSFLCENSQNLTCNVFLFNDLPNFNGSNPQNNVSNPVNEVWTGNGGLGCWGRCQSDIRSGKIKVEGYKYVTIQFVSPKATCDAKLTISKAHFVKRKSPVSIFSNDKNLGQVNVTDNPSKINFDNGNGGITKNNVLCGTTFQVTAVPEECSEFVRWSDGSEELTRTITVSDEIHLTAEFKKKEFDATIQPNNAELGVVTIDGSSSTNADGSFSLQDVICGTTITKINAEATAKCAEFIRWSDGVESAERELTVKSDTTIKAIFIYTSNEIVAPNANQVVCHGSEIEDIIVRSTQQIKNLNEVRGWCENTVGGLTVTEQVVSDKENLGEDVVPCTDYFEIKKPDEYTGIQFKLKEGVKCPEQEFKIYFYDESKSELIKTVTHWNCQNSDFAYHLNDLESGQTYYIEANLGGNTTCLSKFEKDLGTIAPKDEYIYTISGTPGEVGEYNVTMKIDGSNDPNDVCSAASMGISIRVQKLSISDPVVTNPTCYDASNAKALFRKFLHSNEHP